MRMGSRFILSAAALLALSAVSAADMFNGQRPGVPTGTIERLSPSLIAVVLDSTDVNGVLGKEVRSVAGENMGRIIEVVVDRFGQVRAAVIDFGGFLGVGNRKVAIDWSLLQFGTAGDRGGAIALSLTQDQLRTAPEYKAGKPVAVVGALGELSSSPARMSAVPE